MKQIRIALSAFCLAVFSVATAQNTNAPVAIRFQAAPIGLPYDWFSQPLLNASGQVAFSAHHVAIERPTIYAGPRGGILVVAEEGITSVPGTGGTFGALDFLVQNSNGQIAFPANVVNAADQDSTNNTGLWLGTTGALQIVVREGWAATGTEAGTYYEDFEFLLPSLNNRGELAFAQYLAGPQINGTNSVGIWLADTNAARLIARAGSVAPDVSPTAYFESFEALSSGGVALNDSGNLAFQGTLAGLNTATNEGIWLGNTNSLNIAVREGTQENGTFLLCSSPAVSTFGNPILNNANQVLFSSFLSGPSVSLTNDSSLWLHEGGTNRLVAREGDLAPELVDVYLGMFDDTSFFLPRWHGLAGNGHVAFFNYYLSGPAVTTTNDEALWAGPIGALKLISREGSPAPGTTNATFASFREFAVEFSPACINPAGQVAFFGRLSGLGVSFGNDLGIWMSQPDSEPVLIARTGQQLDVGGGVMRTISGLSFQRNSGAEDGEPNGFGADNQMVFYASFTDSSSGLFLATVVAGRPVITEISRLDSDIRVKFTTSAGGNYQLEYKDSLLTNIWSPLSNQIVGTGGIVSVTNVGVANLPQRFYRAVLLP